LTTILPWQQRVGNQRDWIWRGWQTRYTYIRPQEPHSKTPLILLHGFGASIGHWRHNLEILSQQHTVYALDLLGFGASQKATANYNIKLWVQQVYDFWKFLIRQPAILVGNSIGSLVCLAAADTHPDMVQGIVMMSLPDPSLEQEAIPVFLQPVVAGIKNIVASPLLLKAVFNILRRPSVLRGWAGIAYARSSAVTPELVEILAHPTEDQGSAMAFSALFKAVSAADFGPKVKLVLPRLKMPILLIWGLQDRMVPPKFARQFADYNPNVHLVSLENAGHCPHDECPEAVNQAILEWTSRCFRVD